MCNPPSRQAHKLSVGTPLSQHDDGSACGGRLAPVTVSAHDVPITTRLGGTSSDRFPLFPCTPGFDWVLRACDVKFPNDGLCPPHSTNRTTFFQMHINGSVRFRPGLRLPPFSTMAFKMVNIRSITLQQWSIPAKSTHIQTIDTQQETHEQNGYGS